MSKLSEIPNVRLNTEGVMYKYLLLKIEVGKESKEVVRGLTSLVDETETVQWVERELEKVGIEEGQRQIEVLGGGSFALNPYYETITLFGASPKYGEESDRLSVATLMETVFEDFKVAWHSSDTSAESKEKSIKPMKEE